MKKAFLGLAFALSCTLASAQELSPLGTGNTPMEPAAIGTAHKPKPRKRARFFIAEII